MDEKGIANETSFIRMVTKRSRGAEYTCGRRWVDLGPIDVINVRAEAHLPVR